MGTITPDARVSPHWPRPRPLGASAGRTSQTVTLTGAQRTHSDMKELHGFDWDGVIVDAKTGAPLQQGINALRVQRAAGNECVVLTCNTDPDHVRQVCRVLFGGDPPEVHRFKRSDVDGKARWLAANRGKRKAWLYDDQWRYLHPAVELGVSTVYVGGKKQTS